MRILANVDTEKVVSIDIETVRLFKDYKDLPANLKAAWYYDRKWKDNHQLEENSEEDLARLWENEASFKPEFSKIVAVSLAFQHKGVLRCKEFASYDEILLLTDLERTLDKFEKDGYILGAHSGYFFDYPFLAMRFLYNGFSVPAILDEGGLEPWKKKLLDTNHIRKSFGTSPGGSLLSLCVAFGIPFSKTEISGGDVGKKYFEGKLKEISAYCSLDTIAGYNLLRAMKSESIFDPEGVVYVNKGEILVGTPLLSAIRDAGKIDAAQKKKLIAEAKPLSAGGRQNLVLFLKAALIKKDPEFTKDENDFFQKVLVC